MKQQTFCDAIAASPPANPFADARPIERCDKCGGEEFADRVIHGGRSTIRECRRCRRFMGFSVWYGRQEARNDA